MDVSQMQKLPGMPSGFPFAMVLLGIVATIVGSIFTSIDTLFFTRFGLGLQSLSYWLISFGSGLQGALWICTAFSKKPSGPTP